MLNLKDDITHTITTVLFENSLCNIQARFTGAHKRPRESCEKAIIISGVEGPPDLN